MRTVTFTTFETYCIFVCKGNINEAYLGHVGVHGNYLFKKNDFDVWSSKIDRNYSFFFTKSVTYK